MSFNSTTGRTDLLDVVRLENYGPVSYTTAAGTLRPSAVRYLQGIQFDASSADRLLFPLKPGGQTLPLSVTGNMRITSTTQPVSAARGILELSGSNNSLRLVYSATTISALVGSVTATLNTSLSVGDVVSFSTTATANALTVSASVNSGPVVSASTSGTINETYTQIDIGLANGVRAGAALESILVWSSAISTSRVASVAFSGTSPEYEFDPAVVFAALTPETFGLVANTRGGSGYYAIRSANGTSGFFRANAVEQLETNSIYVQMGAVVYLDLPPATGLVTSDILQLEDGITVQIVAINSSSVRDEVYASVLAGEGGGGYTANYLDTY